MSTIVRVNFFYRDERPRSYEDIPKSNGGHEGMRWCLNASPSRTDIYFQEETFGPVVGIMKVNPN